MIIAAPGIGLVAVLDRRLHGAECGGVHVAPPLSRCHGRASRTCPATTRGTDHRRQHHAADDFARAEIAQHFIDVIERPGRGGNRRRSGSLDQFDKLFRFRQASGVGALDGDRAHRERRQRHGDFAAIEPDDDQLAALDQAVDAEPRRAGGTDQIDHRPGAAVGRGDELLHGIRRCAVDHRGRRRPFSPPRACRHRYRRLPRCGRPSPCARQGTSGRARRRR